MKEKVCDWLAFQRIPPNSQIERAKPHEQRIIHLRESASILSAQLRGRMRTKNFWSNDINVVRRLNVLQSMRRGGELLAPSEYI